MSTMITELYKALLDAGAKADVAQAAAEAVADHEGMKQEIKNSELRLEVKIAETKAELVRWVVAVGVLQTTLVAAMLLKLIPH